MRLRRQPAGRDRRLTRPDPAEELLPIEEVETPDATTIADLAAFLGVGRRPTAKAAFFMAGDGRLITAIVRGDWEVNETKLVNAAEGLGRAAAGARSRRSRPPAWSPATARPIGAHDTLVVVDELAAALPEPRRRGATGSASTCAT